LGAYVPGLLGSEQNVNTVQGGEFSESFSTVIFYASWSVLRKREYGRNVRPPFFP
jgi:hypothetical protein